MNSNSSTKDLNITNNERLFFQSSSIFKPKKITNLKPNFFKVYTFKAGFKKKIDDLLIIIFNKTVNSISVYSKTSTPSAPIIWDKKNNKGKVKSLIVNSGNANAHTGITGLKVIEEYVSHLSKKINCKKNEVLVSSTGVIGEAFKASIINKQINNLQNTKITDLKNAAKSIMTTDTYPKVSVKKVIIDNIKFKIYGIAKGSGMIQPNMGTMLSYIFIDLDLTRSILKKIMYKNLDYTFNSISVDSDTSTSDTLSMFSVGKEKVNIKNKENFEKLNTAVYKVMHDLSLQVIKDGEGLSKLLRIKILKCKSKNQAKNIGFAIANSPLVKTAIAGKDANWGRIIMAIGKSYEKIDQNKIEIFFGKILLCKNGEINKNLNLIKLNNYMKKNIIDIAVIIGNGNIDHTIYGNDLTNDYIRINADYRS